MLLKSNNLRSNLKLKTNFIKTSIKKSKSISKTILYIPNNWNLLLINLIKPCMKLVVLTQQLYTFKFPIPNSRLIINWCSVTRNLVLVNDKSLSIKNTYLYSLHNLLYTFTKPTFRKLKFKGKGYYIYKNSRNTIAPQFGFSHRVYIYSFINSVKFIGKTSVIIFGLNKLDVTLTSREIRSKRFINVFTGRGVRFARQIVYRKPGKVSSYK